MQQDWAPADKRAGQDRQQEPPAAPGSEAQPAPPGAETLAEASARLRNALVDSLKARGLLHSKALERAMRQVPREQFVPEIAERDGLERVYADEALITKRSSHGQPLSSSSAPSMMAIMLEQLDLSPGQRVLEIGAGTGYNAALLAELVGDPSAITTLDIEPDVVEQARQHLNDAGYPEIRVLSADGILGAPDLAPFERIELTVASDDIAPAWISQLSSDGRLVVPLELHRYQRGQISLAFVKHEGHLESVAAATAFFIPLRGVAAMPIERSAALSVGSTQDKDHHWELTVYGAPISASAAIRRDVLHLLSGPSETRSLHLDGPVRALLSYLDLRYGERNAIYVWSGNAIWGFEGWAAGFYQSGSLSLAHGAGLPNGLGCGSISAGGPLTTGSSQVRAVEGIESYGSNAAWRQLQRAINEWKHLRQPDLEALSVRAYLPGQAPAPAPDEWLMSKRSMDLLLSFQQLGG